MTDPRTLLTRALPILKSLSYSDQSEYRTLLADIDAALAATDEGWTDIEKHVGTDDDEQPKVLVYDGFNKETWIAEWDGDCGYFQGITCLENKYKDGGRLYGATLFMPIPKPPVQS